MSEKDFLQWLQRERLLDTVKANYPAFKSVLQNSLKLNGQKILMIGDLGEPDKRVSPLVLGCYAMAAKELNTKFEVTFDQEHYADSINAFDDENSIITAMSQKVGNLFGRSFRSYAKEKRHRYLVTPGLGNLTTSQFTQLVTAMNVDYNEMFERGQKLKYKLDAAKEVFVYTDKGTELYVSNKGIKAINNSGIYEENGMGGNIPAGEVYTAPRATHVEGRVVVDGSLRTINGTVLLKKPVTFEFEKGKMVEISGEQAHLIEKSLEWAEDNSKYPGGIRRFSELGIGTNPKASIVGPTVINEKTLGTAHFALGSNAWFGGSIYAVVHLDQVFKNPYIEADGKLIEY